MTALHVLGADHFWSNVPMFVVLGLFVFLGAMALRTKFHHSSDRVSRASRQGGPPEGRGTDDLVLPGSVRLESASRADPNPDPEQEPR